MSATTPLPGNDTGLSTEKDHRWFNFSYDELQDIAFSLHRIRDLTCAGKVIIGFHPAMMELEGNPALEGLFGIFAGIDQIAAKAAPPIERNL